MSGPDLRIDRLVLRVTGLDEGAAGALARLVAEALAGQAGLAGGPGRVQVQVTASAAEQQQPSLLARRITSEIARMLAYGQGSGYPGGEAR